MRETFATKNIAEQRALRRGFSIAPAQQGEDNGPGKRKGTAMTFMTYTHRRCIGDASEPARIC